MPRRRAEPVAKNKPAAKITSAAKTTKKGPSAPRRWLRLPTFSLFRRSGKASASRRERRRRDPVSPLTRRSRIPVALAAAFAVAVLATNFPYSTLLSQHRQLSAAAAQLHQVQSANRALSEQNQQLNSTTEIDRLARQDYQLVSPNQTLYNVLPASGRSTSTTPGGPTSGDPGDQPLVAPADAPDMSPDPGLPRATPTSASSGSPAGTAVAGHRRRARPRRRDRCRAGRVSGPGCPTRSNSGSDRTAPGRTRGRRTPIALMVVAELLGRPPAGEFEVIVRNEDGAPAVIANAPFLLDGTPMPTRYWLVDPALRDAVSRIESAGGVRQAEAAVGTGSDHRRPYPLRRRTRRAHPRRTTADPGRRGEWAAPGRASSAFMPIWPGG